MAGKAKAKVAPGTTLRATGSKARPTPTTFGKDYSATMKSKGAKKGQGKGK